MPIASSEKNRYSDWATGWTIGYLGFDSRQRLGIFLFTRVQNGSGAHPASYPIRTGSSSLGVKRPEREANHSSPSSAEVKYAWSYTSTPPVCLHGVVISQAEGKLYLYVTVLGFSL
jgi:hypothetical protein